MFFSSAPSIYLSNTLGHISCLVVGRAAGINVLGRYKLLGIPGQLLLLDTNGGGLIVLWFWCGAKLKLKLEQIVEAWLTHERVVVVRVARVYRT